ncbi:MAG: hypothetical protein LHV68_05310 [Elusimicrobia bacterium]|nr:hypothetical protein [Candidatus Liberimonas magnetica]
MNSKQPKRTIKCLICSKRFKAINNGHLVNKHGYDGINPVEDYKNEYGLSKATSEYTRKLIGKDKIDNKYWVGRKHKRKSILKMKLVHSGVKATEETRKKLSKQRIGNKNALGLKHSKEFKKRISEINRKLWAENKRKYENMGQGGNKKHIS